jgi:hypothetical protein
MEKDLIVSVFFTPENPENQASASVFFTVSVGKLLSTGETPWEAPGLLRPACKKNITFTACYVYRTFPVRGVSIYFLDLARFLPR